MATMAMQKASAFVEHDARFGDVLGDAPRLVRVVEVDAHEGPVYVPREDALYFSSVPRVEDGVPRVSIRRIQLDGSRFPLESARITTVVDDANVANGMALDRADALVICEQGTVDTPARIGLLDLVTGELETVVDSVEGKPLNSPNDVVVRRDGTIWFTDPSYGHLQGFRPAPALPDQVYRYDPRNGRVAVAASGFDKPNGLAFSLDEQTLYVGDNGAPRELVAFDVGDDGGLAGRHHVATGTPGHPDGLKVDTADRIYASGTGGVQIFEPDGVLIGEIDLPGTVNFTFGGAGGNVLYITTDAAVWAAVLNAKGA